MNKKQVVVLDIDGVLLDSDCILKEIEKHKLQGEAMWSYFYSNCNSDRVLPLINTISFIKYLNPSVQIILSTARNEKCRSSTERRLQEEGVFYNALYMRSEKDRRPSPDVKNDHLNDIISKGFSIIAFIDDDLSNCQMASQKGILSLRKV